MPPSQSPATEGLSTVESVSTGLVAGWLNEYFDGAYSLTATLTPASPWVTVDARPSEPYEASAIPGLLRFAIWRETGAVYQLGEDGAVQDDPFINAEDVRVACLDRIMHDEFEPPQIKKPPP